jgi:hypothetical protein
MGLTLPFGLLTSAGILGIVAPPAGLAFGVLVLGLGIFSRD